MWRALAVSGGRLILLSTPFGSRGFYYEEWKQRARWDYYEVPAEECPRISPEFLEEERRTMGDWWYQQEYGCKFLDAQSAPFRTEDIERVVRETFAALGRIDVVVNSCGAVPRGDLLAISDQDWHAALDMVLLSVVRIARA